jgi:hypothetical protein
VPAAVPVEVVVVVVVGDAAMGLIRGKVVISGFPACGAIGVGVCGCTLICGLIAIGGGGGWDGLCSA